MRDRFGWVSAASIIAEGNEASMSVARRLGARDDGPVEFRYGAARLMRHDLTRA